MFFPIWPLNRVAMSNISASLTSFNPALYVTPLPPNPPPQSPQRVCPSNWVTQKTSFSAWTSSSPPTAACRWSWRPRRRAPPSPYTMWPAHSLLPSKIGKSPMALVHAPPGALWPETCSLTSGRALACPTPRLWRPQRSVSVQPTAPKRTFIIF